MRMIIQVLIKNVGNNVEAYYHKMNREGETDTSNCESNWHDVNKVKNDFKTKIHDNANKDN